MSAKKQTHHTTRRKPRSTFKRLARRFMSGVLRSLFFISTPQRYKQTGFVLPTTVMLLLVVTLTVGAISFRTASRTQSASVAREQQVIDNIAAPAIDRAKAKLEYLFSNDTRLPGTGTPSSDVLVAYMLNTTDSSLGITALGTDPYTLPDESRLDLNGDDVADNAWEFAFDLDGDGAADDGEVIAYSLLMDDSIDPADAVGGSGTATGTRDDDIKLEDTGTAANELKAKNLITRNGPINTDESLSNCGGSREPEQGWLAISSAALEKNFQITAFVSNGKELGRANSAMELQQVRRALKGNRWGAWFKYDLELHPGPVFNWNGAIHTDGNLMVMDDFRAHMISSHNSCLYTPDASRMTMAQKDNDGDGSIDVTAGDFQGQLILGAPGRSTGYGQSGGTTDFHIYTDSASSPKILVDNTTKLSTDRDSIQKKGGGPGDKPDGNPIDIAVDPVALFSKDISQHRSTSTWERASNWSSNAYNTGDRIINDNVDSPYLDDFFRADNRYGPRPNYDSTNWVTATDDGVDNSAANKRGNADYDKSVGEEIISTDPNADNIINETDGLDGYWERQSITNGMRLVVGQRLELGDSQSWNFDAQTGAVVANADALYPPNSLGSNENKQKQRVTLRDNLSAVQGMVVYHYESDSGQYPLACVANTAHPGTYETLRASRDFKAETFQDSSGSDVTLISNFLDGKGTNGWEYDFPATFAPSSSGTAESFGAALAANRPLGIGLRNLAYFAGDPNGGSPSFPPIQDGNVHPSPLMSMWGDFSVLRRIFDERLDDTANWNSALSLMSDRYDALSPADKSSLHSAACTMGLLTKNLTSLDKLDWSQTISAGTYSGISNQGQVMTQVGKPVWDAFGITNSGITSGSFADTYCTLVSSVGPKDTYDCTGANPTKEQIIAASSLSSGATHFIDSLSNFTQVQRDRTYGFENSPASTSLAAWEVKIGNDTYTFDFPDDCHPGNSAGSIAPLFSGSGGGLDDEKAGVALVCSTAPKYPSLHYLFPFSNHDQNDNQPSTEEYIASSYIFDDSGASPTGVNSAATYKVVGDDDNDGAEESGELGMSAIAFDYRTTWQLPKTDNNTAATLDANGNPTIDTENMEIVDIDGTVLSVPLLDKVMYNGREEIAVRVLDVDLGKLTNNKNSTDYWISNERESLSGIMYAAREDAAREDSIVRPAADVWTKCDTLSELVSSDCYMDTSSSSPEDPPLSRRDDGTLVGISLKPIDFAPDPDRRPHGFRLNADLDSNAGDLSAGLNRDWGFTFVTDNAAYIKGEFNPHSTNGTDTVEEFIDSQTLLDDDVSYGGDFYSKRKDLNTGQFATDSTDRWRVAEILADSVSLLSSRHVDGSVEEGFIRDRDEASTVFQNSVGALSLTSFHNQQRPLQENDDAWDPADNWLRADGNYPKDNADSVSSPVWVGRNGESRSFSEGLFDNAESDTDFEVPSDRDKNALIRVPHTLLQRMNATIISGIVPSRQNQGYGGLHNFPRFQERWETDDSNGTPLFIQGAFLQLNFSTASTGAFDADSWDPGESASTDQRIRYYDPPNRRWGYDVALQYSPAGPIAQRFVTIEKPRSEHYREIPIEDPYATNLRCAREKDGSGNWVRTFAQEDCS